MIKQILTILDEGHEGDHMGDHMTTFFGGWWWMWLIMIASIFLVLMLSIWTYNDAKRLGENAVLWALVVFFTMGFGIIFYALIRISDRSVPVVTEQSSPHHQDQASSAQMVTYSPKEQYTSKLSKNDTSRFCEYCGAPLAGTDNFCSECGKMVRSA